MELGPDDSVLVEMLRKGDIDAFSSVTRPVRELKGFNKVHIKPGETKTVTFEITPELLSFYDIDMNYLVEPGEFVIMIGSSSRDEDLLKTVLNVN